MIVAAISTKQLELLELVDTNPHRNKLRKIEREFDPRCPVNLRDRWAKVQSVNAMTVTGFMHGKDSFSNNKALCGESLKKLQEYNKTGFMTSYGVIFFVLIAIVLDKHAVQLLSGRGGCIHSKPFFCNFCCCRNKESLPSVYLCHECDMERKEFPDGISPPATTWSVHSLGVYHSPPTKLSLTAISHHPTDPGLVATAPPRLDGRGLVWNRLQKPCLDCDCDKCQQTRMLPREFLTCHHSELIGSNEETLIMEKRMPYIEFPKETARKRELFAAVEALNLSQQEYETVKLGRVRSYDIPSTLSNPNP